MIVQVCKPFKDNKYYNRAHSPGDILDLPEKYAEHLLKLGAVAEPKNKKAKVSIQTPKPPDEETGQDAAKAEEAAPQNKAEESENGKGE